MSKVDDMTLFVQVVKANGLAAAGRQLGLSPASMTARINRLEQRYQTRLLNRNTRSITLTHAGERFYQGCLRVLDEVAATEASLSETEAVLSGTLRISAPSDFGLQYVAPALAAFVAQHPQVIPHLYLTDGVVKLVEDGLDMAIRYGNLPDSNLIAKPLADNRRVLCASPAYLRAYGMPIHPNDLLEHRCLVMERHGELLNEWYFRHNNQLLSLKVTPAMVSGDGGLIRAWALAGCGIALKSLVDVQADVNVGNLQLLFEGQVKGFSYIDSEKTDSEKTDSDSIGLQAIFPSRKFQPRQVRAFTEFFESWLQSHSPAERSQ